MRLEAVVWSCFDGDTDALGLRLLRVSAGTSSFSTRRGIEEQDDEPDCLVDIVARVAGERVVQLRDELVAVLLAERHEGTSHDDELDLFGNSSSTTEEEDPVWEDAPCRRCAQVTSAARHDLSTARKGRNEREWLASMSARIPADEVEGKPSPPEEGKEITHSIRLRRVLKVGVGSSRAVAVQEEPFSKRVKVKV